MASTGGKDGKFSRRACWASKEAYFQCLNNSSSSIEGPGKKTDSIDASPSSSRIVLGSNDPGTRPATENRKKYCSEDRKIFEERCLPSWVKHFEVFSATYRIWFKSARI